VTILLGSPPIWGTAARYASISSSRSWTVGLFLVKRAGPFFVFFLLVGTALGLVATSAGAAGAFRACCLGCLGDLGLQNERKYAVNLNSTRARAPAKGGGSYWAGPFTGATFIRSSRVIGFGNEDGDSFVAGVFFGREAASLPPMISTFNGRSNASGVNQRFADRQSDSLLSTNRPSYLSTAKAASLSL
jgi:hypothetical protein